jgi:hypothetical protein
MSILCIYSALGLMSVNLLLSNSSAQIMTAPISSGENGTLTDIFRVVITLFGVDDKTNNVLAFVKVNNMTSAKYFNATKEDSDRDGIVFTPIGFPNQTISAGTNFTACEVVLNDLTMVCKGGLNAPAVTEIVQIVRPTYEQR